MNTNLEDSMKPTNGKQSLFRVAVLGMLLMLILPLTAFGDHRRNGRNRDSDKRDRKCAKFVNCHDARDGRRDGRGPRRDLDNGRRRFSRNNRFDRRHRIDERRGRRRDGIREMNPLNTVRVRGRR